MIVDELMGALERYEARLSVVAAVEGRTFDIGEVNGDGQRVTLVLTGIAPPPAGAARIAALNDQLRCLGEGGQVVVTAGVLSLGEADVREIVAAVRAFDRFCDDNDPHGEHDFGALEVAGRRIFFKIDYYDQTLTAASPDPVDPDITRRVMTIMLAEEY